jgi:SAM-dependent methyltransferase
MILEAFWMLRHATGTAVRSVRSWPKSLSAWWRFWKRYASYTRMAAPDAQCPVKNLSPILGEDRGHTSVEPIYFYQDAWAFERIVADRPDFHVDIGSHHRFAALLSKVVTLSMLDIRPLSCTLASLNFCAASILRLPFRDSSLSSVSCICVVEHIGLGRYGDPIDPNGARRAVEELKRIVKPRGNLYVSLPLNDHDVVYYDAHRAYKESTVMAMFFPFEVVEKRYIFGNRFGTELESGFGTGCYHLRRT